MTSIETPDQEDLHAKKMGERDPRRHHLLVTLTDENLEAFEGWRQANGFDDPSEGLREIVRLGLLSEIAKVYRSFSDDRR
ncbi:hypothetical protein FHS85_004609 [Rhodoligotrophos appendicifer]|uniref:hypothetical protein n=1 Tax=Rhodoligotrophos appendicifer TaxID=987056 RepID=UPI001186AD0E|nr:hypothetical protein [Rhodoligotrophos appendicifer]